MSPDPTKEPAEGRAGDEAESCKAGRQVPDDVGEPAVPISEISDEHAEFRDKRSLKRFKSIETKYLIYRIRDIRRLESLILAILDERGIKID